MTRYAPTYSGQIPDAAAHRGDWVNQSLCRTEDLDLFFEGVHVRKAKSICLRCPVLDHCHTWISGVEAGLSEESRYGVFAALTAGERAELDPEVRRRKQQAAEEHARKAAERPQQEPKKAAPDAPKPKRTPTRPIGELKALPIDDLVLPVRIYNGLRREGVRTIGDLTGLTAADVRSFRRFGDQALVEIKTQLDALGLALHKNQPRKRPRQPCGTYAAALRHQRRGEPLCTPCLAARAARTQNRRRAKQDGLVHGAWTRGLTDAGIAADTGLSRIVVRRARARMGLDAHEEKGAQAA